MSDVKYYPQDKLSKQLLSTVPKKVFTWLSHLGVSRTEPGVYNDLAWDFSEGTEGIFVANGDEKIYLSWTGDPVNPDEVFGNCKWMEDIPHNLTSFIMFENVIYNLLTELNAMVENAIRVKLAAAQEAREELEASMAADEAIYESYELERKLWAELEQSRKFHERNIPPSSTD